MSEEKFTPLDEEFLQELGKKSEVSLGQNKISYEEFLNKFREIHSFYKANEENDPYAVNDMIGQIKDLLVQGDNPPEKERAARDFLKEIGELE